MSTSSSTKIFLHGRKAARVAAIQALYQAKQTNDSLSHVMEEFKIHRFQTPTDEIVYLRTDVELFEKIMLAGAAMEEKADLVIQDALSEDLKWERMELTLVSILRAGAYELICNKEVPLPVLLNEYTEITKLFFHEREPALVNAVLERLASLLQKEN